MAVARQSKTASPIKALTAPPKGLSPFYHRLGQCLRLCLHAVNMLRPRESAGADVGRIALDRRLDHRAEVAIAADEFRGPWRQTPHVLQHEHLAVAGSACTDADGRNVDHLGDL